MDGGAWKAAVHGVTKSPARLSNFTFTFHFHALEKEMATHSSVLAWRIPGTGEPGGLPFMGSHRVRNDWSDLAVAVAAAVVIFDFSVPYLYSICRYGKFKMVNSLMLLSNVSLLLTGSDAWTYLHNPCKYCCLCLAQFLRDEIWNLSNELMCS